MKVDHTGVPVERFEGVGFQGDTYPYLRNNPTFCVTIPAGIIWHAVPPQFLQEAVQTHGNGVVRDMVIELGMIVESLVDQGFLA